MPSIPPSRTQLISPETEEIERELAALKLTGAPAPLQLGSSLDSYAKADLTPVIGTEFTHGAQLSDMLKAPNADELLKDLAILTSQRGVVFFRDQELTLEEQKQLAQKLGELTGKPESSKLHLNASRGLRSQSDGEVTVVTAEGRKAYKQAYSDEADFAATTWHVDIVFEPVPSDYAVLKMHTLPSFNGHVAGGDTLWASGYELYDRLSPSFAKYLETLEALHERPYMGALKNNTPDYSQRIDRGSPANVSKHPQAVHPLIRTNPVTGWKSVFFSPYMLPKRIVGVTKDESDVILKYLCNLVQLNHDLQVRFKWEKDSVAIWDNRSVYHAATYDYGDERRVGNRVISLGEKPYLDPTSKSRREALGL